MTALMQHVLRRLSATPEREQDRLARRVLDLPELTAPGTAEPAPSLAAIASETNGHARSKEEIDRRLDTLRDEWDR